jgi:hypothetical protein
MILAQQSAFGLLPENKTGLTGIYYQKFIRWGIVLAKILFTKNQSDLHLLLNKPQNISSSV